VTAWIDEIVDRRVADTHPPAEEPSPGLGLLSGLWAQRVEVELAGLLSRRGPPVAQRPGVCRWVDGSVPRPRC
jgi:hypothetical protein